MSTLFDDWALDMARNCLSVGQYGEAHWVHFPREGGWHEQDDFEMATALNAWAIERMVYDEKFFKENVEMRVWMVDNREPERPYVSVLWMMQKDTI